MSNPSKTTKDIESIIDSLRSYMSLDEPINIIGNNTNLNSLSTMGLYQSKGSSITGTLLNKPDGLTYGFQLIVDKILSGSNGLPYYRQTIIENAGKSRIYTRASGYQNTSDPSTLNWLEWQTVAYLSDLETETDEDKYLIQYNNINDSIEFIIK